MVRPHLSAASQAFRPLPPAAEPFDGCDQRAPDAGFQRRVSRVRDDGHPGVAPGRREIEGGRGRADHVIAALHDLRRDVADPVHVPKQTFGRQEQAMREVVRLDPRQPQRGAILGEAADGLRARQQRAARAFIDRPGTGRRQMNRRIGVGQAAEVGAQQIGAFGLRQEAGERGVGFGEHQWMPCRNHSTSCARPRNTPRSTAPATRSGCAWA